MTALRFVEPFSTHRPWDELTHQAYREQPEQNGKHYRLGDHCTAEQKAEWREWCRKYPNHWPSHVHAYVAERKRKST